MGLDIRVRVTADEVLENLASLKNFEMQAKAVDLLENMGPELICVRPGSYSGLHDVRVSYGRLHGRNLFPAELSKVFPNSHLINHSDCDGWYLPDDFVDPVWIQEGLLSVGSSQALLREVWELHGKMPLLWESIYVDGVVYAWEAVFIAAVASVVTRTPIEFC